jgi:hypothetical protein
VLIVRNPKGRGLEVIVRRGRGHIPAGEVKKSKFIKFLKGHLKNDPLTQLIGVPSRGD